MSVPLRGWAGVQGGQGSQDNPGRSIHKATEFQPTGKSLGDKGPPLSQDGHRLFFSKKQSSAGMIFTADNKKWNKIRITLRGQIDLDFGPSCVAKIMDLSEKDEIQKIAESLEKKTMVFKIKITNMGAPYESAQIVKKIVNVQDNAYGPVNICFDDIIVGPDKSDWHVYIQAMREGTDPSDTFEGTFHLQDMEVILPQVEEDLKEEQKKKELEARLDTLDSLAKLLTSKQTSGPTVLDPTTLELVNPGTYTPVQTSPATLAEVLKNCDLATLQKLKQLGILQLENKQMPVLGDPLNPPPVIDVKPPGVPLGKMGGRKVDPT